MWLPTRLYEALPTIYVIIGLTFLAGSLYIGLDHPLAPMYFMLGAGSILSGLYVSQRRLWERRQRQQSDEQH